MINLSAVKPHVRNKQTVAVLSKPQLNSQLLNNKINDKNPNQNISARGGPFSPKLFKNCVCVFVCGWD